MSLILNMNDIISDRGPQFISHVWKHLWRCLKISCKLSSGYHHKLTEKPNTQIKCSNNIFDASSIINKMIGVIFYTFPRLHTTTWYTLLPKLPLSWPTLATTLDGVSEIFSRCHEILVRCIRKVKNMMRSMQIDIVLSVMFRLLIEYGCFVITSRLPNRVLSSIVNG